MRTRATLAAVTGALALSALAVPAAQADDSTYHERAEAAFAAAHGGSQKSAFSTAVYGDLDVSYSNFKLTSAITVGTTAHVATTVTYTLTHGADVDIHSADFATGPYIYKGSFDAPDNILFGYDAATCTDTSATTATCKGLVDIYPDEGDLVNSDAGTWKGGALALDYATGTYADQGDLGTTLVKRASKLTVNASPEPVTKGKTITVTGRLTRANWETGTYTGYSGVYAQLQFRKKSSTTYSTVKSVKTTSTGGLATTVKASVDGYYRYSFVGTTTAPAVKAAGDFVDVR
ncbi:hypothetical protein [Streptomyces sp. NPDC003247]|uniref:hypothetical protein n=1 Tax=Streptomyces sp. NPDC003247 TaxID=3364677 RepID=UPI0036C6A414